MKSNFSGAFVIEKILKDFSYINTCKNVFPIGPLLTLGGHDSNKSESALYQGLFHQRSYARRNSAPGVSPGLAQFLRPLSVSSKSVTLHRS
jgi:hypothetical protein